MLPFINLYPHKPLIYNVAWKTTVYVLVATLVHYLEHLADFWKEAGSLVAANQKLLAEIVWPHFWAMERGAYGLRARRKGNPRAAARRGPRSRSAVVQASLHAVPSARFGTPTTRSS